MSKLYGPIDTFAISPFLAILPESGDSRRLIALRSSLFARLENVAAQKAVEGFDFNSDEGKRVSAEENMLREVLTWLDSKGGED